jgi:hypothetical protein
LYYHIGLSFHHCISTLDFPSIIDMQFATKVYDLNNLSTFVSFSKNLPVATHGHTPSHPKCRNRFDYPRDNIFSFCSQDRSVLALLGPSSSEAGIRISGASLLCPARILLAVAKRTPIPATICACLEVLLVYIDLSNISSRHMHILLSQLGVLYFLFKAWAVSCFPHIANRWLLSKICEHFSLQKSGSASNSRIVYC